MSLPTSLHAYAPEIDAFERAVASERGIRIKSENWTKARHYINRLHQARVLDRKENARVYDANMPMHGKSQYDAITCRLIEAGGEFWIHLEKNEILPGNMEEL